MRRSPMLTSYDERTSETSDFATLARMEEEFEKRNAGYFDELLRRPLSLFLRIHTVCMLADIGGEESATVLSEVLRQDPSPLVRHEAAFALGQMGRRSAIPALVKTMLGDLSKLVRHESAAALGSIGAHSARAQLEQASTDPDIDVRLSARVALNYLDYLKQRPGARLSWNSRPHPE